jgi:large subunit ribosomal protein L23
VPLKLNKLDMRDYMWNCYGINCRGVRSYIQIQKLRQDKPKEKRPKPRKWFRPRSIKKMLIEMDRPFVWPQVEGLEQYVNVLITLLFICGWLFVGFGDGCLIGAVYVIVVD